MPDMKGRSVKTIHPCNGSYEYNFSTTFFHYFINKNLYPTQMSIRRRAPTDHRGIDSSIVDDVLRSGHVSSDVDLDMDDEETRYTMTLILLSEEDV